MFCAQQERFILLSKKRIFESVRGGGGGLNVYVVLCFRTYKAQDLNCSLAHNFCLKTGSARNYKSSEGMDQGTSD